MNRSAREILARAVTLTAQVITQRDHPDRPLSKVPGLSVRNDTNEAEILVYGDIGYSWWSDGITASDMAAALAEVTAPVVNVRINSGGGDMFEGTAIYTQLMRHRGRVVTHIDGLAGSAASVVAMGGAEVRISDAGVLMIHDASTSTYGNGAAHREAAELLDKLSDVVAGIYANNAGEDVEHWRALMSDASGMGTWYTGQEAYDAGLVDVVERLEELSDPEPVLSRAQSLAGRERAPERVSAHLSAHALRVGTPNSAGSAPDEALAVDNARDRNFAAWAMSL